MGRAASYPAGDCRRGSGLPEPIQLRAVTARVALPALPAASVATTLKVTFTLPWRIACTSFARDFFDSFTLTVAFLPRATLPLALPSVIALRPLPTLATIVNLQFSSHFAVTASSLAFRAFCVRLATSVTFGARLSAAAV